MQTILAGHELRARRRRAGLNLSQFSEQSGVNISSLSLFERGKIPVMSYANMMAAQTTINAIDPPKSEIKKEALSTASVATA